MTTTTIGAGSDTLALGISEDAYLGDAQFTVGVDGQQVGGVLTASSLHSGGTSDTVDVLGNWGAAPHTVRVNFLNDLWNGTPETDRNLYIDGATYNGVFVPKAAQEIAVNGPVSFSVSSAPAPLSTTIGTGADLLSLNVSEDPYQGNAQFTVSIDGKQIGDVLTATALHGSGLSDTINVQADLLPGAHTVTVNFLNDAYGGSPSQDRNLYIDSATYSGTTVNGAAQELNVNGPVSFSVTDPVATETWLIGTTEASLLSPTLTPGDALIIKGGATVLAEGTDLNGVGVTLNGAGSSPTQSATANLTLTGATVGALAVSYDYSRGITGNTDFYNSHFGHVDAYGQTTITGGITIGGSRPAGPGFLDAYVHGSDGVLTFHGAFLGGPSTLTIKGDQGSAIENDGNINIEGGTVTGAVTILDNLQGTGTITGGADEAGDTASIHLGGSVGSGQTINLNQVNLQLDQPMQFGGTLAGFNAGRGSGVTLSNEDVTSASFTQSAPGVGTLSLATQDPTSGVAGATLAFHLTGTFASNAFAFTNNAAAHSAFVTLAA